MQRVAKEVPIKRTATRNTFYTVPLQRHCCKGSLRRRQQSSHVPLQQNPLHGKNGEISFEPLNLMIADDEVTVAKYAKDNDMLDTPGWKALKRLANRTIKLTCLINQAKLRSLRTAPKYMYGFRVPSTYEDALEIDKSNGNTKWQDATALEMQQLKEYSTFIDKGLYATHKIPSGFQRIKVHLVFCCKNTMVVIRAD